MDKIFKVYYKDELLSQFPTRNEAKIFQEVAIKYFAMKDGVVQPLDFDIIEEIKPVQGIDDVK